MQFKAEWTLHLLTVSLLTTPAIAQQSDWEYEGTIYLFAPETTTSIATPARTVESKLSFSDAFSNLDFAFMGAFGASNGRWSLYLDYMFTDLSFGNPPPGPVFSSVDTALKTQVLNGYVAYRVYEEPSVQLDVAAGFRWFDTRSTITLQPIPPGGSNTVDDSWTNPVIGVRARFKMSDRWAATTFFDYGGFQSGEETWQALLTADYAINDNWVLRGGYRYITVDHTLGTNEFSFTQSGPIFGATYRF
ncbi:porin family protein [Ruegeria sp. PrR005]|uniref:porin family protein n=1 Tax=Ruegeria sp. PrR005 TaxID=2706882 RepID=UPI001EF2069C|nr:porin family protein [Ruegeria sp. PrR005]